MDVFRHRLALYLGLKDPSELLGLPARKLLDWQAYACIEPFGHPRWAVEQRRLDERIGHMLAVLWKRLSSPKDPPIKQSRFVPSWRSEQPKQTQEQIADVFKIAMMAVGVKGKRRDDRN